MKRLLVNLWCIGLSARVCLALSAGVLASVGCVDDGPKPPILQGPVGPYAVIQPDAGEDSGVAGSSMAQGGSGGSGQGGSGQGGSDIADAGDADADSGS